MYYRRRIALALLQRLGGKVNATDFQKLLFLVAAKQSTPAYFFVPYHYGCFSFQSYADKRALTKRGYLAEDDNKWVLADDEDFLSTLYDADKRAVEAVGSKHGNQKHRDLIRHVYISFPYYAINSSIAEEYLTKDELRQVARQRPAVAEMGLFTIGYEGRTIDQYLNLLVKNGVRILCDVRRNPLSMKYGFSKGTLSGSVERLGMKYVHIPALGIEPGKRKGLETLADYERLFEKYEQDTLAQAGSSLSALRELVEEKRRAALTCFEADPRYCHRTRIARALQQLPGWNVPVSEL